RRPVAAGHPAQQIDAKEVLAVLRKIVLDQQTPPSAERQPFDVLVLTQCLWNAKLVGFWNRKGTAKRRSTDFQRSGQVVLQQRLVQLEDTGNIVETVTRVVSRQQRAHIDLDGQQIPDDVLIF